jgi:hypothetical protein
MHQSSRLLLQIISTLAEIPSDFFQSLYLRSIRNEVLKGFLQFLQLIFILTEILSVVISVSAFHFSPDQFLHGIIHFSPYNSVGAFCFPVSTLERDTPQRMYDNLADLSYLESQTRNVLSTIQITQWQFRKKNDTQLRSVV